MVIGSTLPMGRLGGASVPTEGPRSSHNSRANIAFAHGHPPKGPLAVGNNAWVFVLIISIRGYWVALPGMSGLEIIPGCFFPAGRKLVPTPATARNPRVRPRPPRRVDDVRPMRSTNTKDEIGCVDGFFFVVVVVVVGV